jgi:hypothetical protein
MSASSRRSRSCSLALFRQLRTAHTDDVSFRCVRCTPAKPSGANLMIPTAIQAKGLRAHGFVEAHFWLIQIPVKFAADVSRFRVKWSNMRAL